MRDLLQKTKIYAVVSVEPALKQCNDSDIPSTILGLTPLDFARATRKPLVLCLIRENSWVNEKAHHTLAELNHLQLIPMLLELIHL